MARPSVDVVVPFRGAPAELQELRESLARLRLRRGDSLLVVDNTPGSAAAEPGDRERGRPHGPDPLPDAAVPAIHDTGLPTPGYARNRGAERGQAEWLLFLDADCIPSPDLLDRYFEPAPGERTGQLAGGVVDEPVPPGSRAVARYAHLRGTMDQAGMLDYRKWGFPKTANAACRRAAFEAVGGFREHIRAAEDADLTFRLRAAGWEVERREAARVVHRSRQSLPAFVVQKLTWGAGAAWLDREHPGAFPARRRPGLAWWGLRTAARGLAAAALTRDRDRAQVALLEPLEQLSYELGRSLPNERPLPTGSPWRRLLEGGS